MGAEIKWTAEGLWAWLAANPGGVKRDRLVTIVRKAQKEALRLWAEMRSGTIGLGYRFEPGAIAGLQMTRRSKSYQTKQIKTLGQAYPYVAPVSRSSSHINGREIKAVSGQMRREVLGGGYSIKAKNGGGAVASTTFTVTGARILNLNNSPNAANYRREFLGFDRGGARDAAWIQSKANELSMVGILKEIQSAQKRALRVSA